MPADRVFDAVACRGAIVVLATFIPSTMHEYLGAGKAVVSLVGWRAAQMLHEAPPIMVPPEYDVALADAVRELTADPQRRPAVGRTGRCRVEQHYNRVELVGEYRKLPHTPGGRS
jgi:glycosyltransferase involved in cell wall biosynthesis